MEYKMVIGVRTDLKLSKGKTAVQAAHAAVMCAIKAKRHHRSIYSRWYREGQKKVVIKLKDLKELYRVLEQGVRQGLVVEVVKDAGLTEVPPGTITCIGLGPARNEVIDRVTGEFSLM